MFYGYDDEHLRIEKDSSASLPLHSFSTGIIINASGNSNNECYSNIPNKKQRKPVKIIKDYKSVTVCIME